MFEVTVIGNGNVGTQLAMNIDALKDFKLKEWFGRSWKNKKIPENGIDKIENLKDADLFIIAVSDSSIQNISKFTKEQENFAKLTIDSVQHQFNKNWLDRQKMRFLRNTEDLLH